MDKETETEKMDKEKEKMDQEKKTETRKKDKTQKQKGKQTAAALSDVHPAEHVRWEVVPELGEDTLTRSGSGGSPAVQREGVGGGTGKGLARAGRAEEGLADREARPKPVG